MDLPRDHGTPSASVVRAVMPEDLHGPGMRRITELELADLHDVVVLPGAVEALASLADAKNAIATSCTVPLAEARMGAAQLVPPSVLVTADDVVHGKPHPEPFLLAAQRLGVDPRRCLVVEDAPKGLEAAQAAGCFTLAVVTTTPREALDADAIVSDLSEVRFETDHTGIRVKLVDEPSGALRQAQGTDSSSVRARAPSPSCAGRRAWFPPDREHAPAAERCRCGPRPYDPAWPPGPHGTCAWCRPRVIVFGPVCR